MRSYVRFFSRSPSIPLVSIAALDRSLIGLGTGTACISRACTHRWVSLGVYLTGVHPMCVHLMGVHLMGVSLMGVHLMGVHLTGSISWRHTS
jgi:hypothetical protein